MIDLIIVQKMVRNAAKLFTDRNAAGNIKVKGAYDFVTAVDEDVQKYIHSELQSIYPEIKFLGEESSNTEIDMTDLVWVLDYTGMERTMELVGDVAAGNATVAKLLTEKYLND